MLLSCSHNYAKNNNIPWTANIRKIFLTNGMWQEYLDKVNETEETRKGPLAPKLFKRLTDQYHQSSFSVINSSSKMKVLNLIKTAPGTESYLTEFANNKHRYAMTRIQLCTHSLKIETGRYSHTDVEDRFSCTMSFKETKSWKLRFTSL